MATTANYPGILVTIRNPHQPPLTVETAAERGILVATDSSGALAGLYRVDDDAEINHLRALGLIVERVPRSPHE